MSAADCKLWAYEQVVVAAEAPGQPMVEYSVRVQSVVLLIWFSFGLEIIAFTSTCIGSHNSLLKIF